MPSRPILHARNLWTACLALVLCAMCSLAAGATSRIQPGDKLDITVFNHPDLSSSMSVTSSGYIRVPVAGSVAVTGLSEQEAAARIASALSTYLYHPAVDVHLATQGQSIFFTGSLVGVQAYQPGETLGAAIGAFRQTLGAQNAASLNSASINSVDLRRVRIQREGHVSPDVDLQALSRSGDSGPALEPGDVVLLRAKPVRVDVRGNVSAPTTVYVYPGDTLAQAVAELGPYSPTTSLATIGLHRDGTDTVVSAAGVAFTQPAQDGDIVTLQPAPHVSVLGMVEKGGDQTLQTKATLLNALYEAGGPNRFADLAHVQVTHEGVTKVCDISGLTHGRLSQNFPVQDGDVIFIPEGHKIDFSAFSSAIGALSSFRYLSGL